MTPLTQDEQLQVLNAVLQAGGLGQRKELVERLGRRLLERSVADGALVRLTGSLYCLPDLAEADQLAHRVGGLLCLTSAALFHRWEVKTVPEVPHILVARGRRIPTSLLPKAQWHRGSWGPDDAPGGMATSRELTLAQCVRSLPEDEALAIADSALRHGEEAIVKRLPVRVRPAQHLPRRPRTPGGASGPDHLRRAGRETRPRR